MNPVISLTETRPGQWVRIVSISAHGGRWHGARYRQRLYQMGLLPGSIIRIEMVYHPGPIIISKGKMRVGVGMGMARRIMVEPVR